MYASPIMDWVFLGLLVPAVLVPIVLLCGFAGCRQILGLEDPILTVAPPTNLRADSIGLDGITLAWDYLDPPPEPVKFDVEINNTSPPLQSIVSDISGRSFTHSGLPPGTTFFYRVRAVRTSDHLASDWVPDPPLLVTTLIFETAFETTTNPANPAAGAAVAGACVVQRIPGSALSRGGSLVRITLTGLANQETRLDFVSISQSLPTTSPQPWDAADLPVPVPFGGVAMVSLQNGTSAVSDIVQYPVTQGQDLIIAFDVDPASQNVLRRTVVGAEAYLRNNTAQAAAQDRAPGYATINNVVYCIERIEVAGPEPPGPIT
ncbi:MAG: fibronectin type III domain-containing protein [Planctomycetaceae bacterium]